MFHVPAQKFVSVPVSGPASVPPPPASWKVEVIADSSGKWCGNAARYVSKQAAELAAADLAMRWFAVREWRVVPSADKAAWDIVNGQVVAI